MSLYHYNVYDVKGNHIVLTEPKEILDRVVSNKRFTILMNKESFNALLDYFQERIIQWFFPNLYTCCHEGDDYMVGIGTDQTKFYIENYEKIVLARKVRLEKKHEKRLSRLIAKTE